MLAHPLMLEHALIQYIVSVVQYICCRDSPLHLQYKHETVCQLVHCLETLFNSLITEHSEVSRLTLNQISLILAEHSLSYCIFIISVSINSVNDAILSKTRKLKYASSNIKQDLAKL